MRCYDFRCDDCGRVFEELVESREEQVPCPACGGTHTRAQLSAFAIGRIGGGASASFEAPAGGFGGGCASGMCGI